VFSFHSFSNLCFWVPALVYTVHSTCLALSRQPTACVKTDSQLYLWPSSEHSDSTLRPGHYCCTQRHAQLLSSQNADLTQEPLLICSQLKFCRTDHLTSYTETPGRTCGERVCEEAESGSAQTDLRLTAASGPVETDRLIQPHEVGFWWMRTQALG